VISLRHFGEAARDAPLVTSNLSAPDGSTYEFEATAGPPALSPDGRAIVFAAREVNGLSQLWLRCLDSPTARPLNGTSDGAYPFWSPDSRFVAFGAGGQLKKLDVFGGPAVVIATLPALFRGGSWNASDDILFGTSGNNRPLFRVSAAGGSVAPVTAVDWHGKPAGRRLPWFPPDGRHFLYNATWGENESCICVGTLDQPEGPESQVVAAVGQWMYVDGYILFTRDRTLFAQSFDVTRLTTMGGPMPIESDVATTGFPRAGVFSAAAGGWLVYQPVLATSSGLGGLQQLTWFDRSGRSMGTLGKPAGFGSIDLSPDETRLGATLTAGDGTTDLWIYDVARGAPTRFTTHPATDQETVWSPDGLTIYWRSGRQGPGDLFKKSADSSASDELVYANAQAKRPTSVSPDGRFLIFNNTPTETGDLWLLPLTNAAKGAALEPRPLLQTPAGEGLGHFSPDGAWVAYQSNESGVQEIYAMPFPRPGGKVRISVDGGTQPRWRHDGREIFYVTPAGELAATEVTLSNSTLVPGRTHTLFGRVFVNRGYQWDVSHDGQRFVVAAGDASTPAALRLVQNWKSALTRKQPL
jgi:Tol biopolymer transport system component